MMSLNIKQKKLIQDWFKAIKEENPTGLGVFDLENDDRFDYGLLEDLRELNDFETLNSAINNYIQELLEAD